MTRDERTGLILLIAFLLIAGVLLGAATDGGHAVTNIFSNIVVNLDEPPSPEIAAQLAPVKEEAAPYFLVAFVALLTSIVALVSIVVYTASRHHVPRSWSLFLLFLGLLSAIALALAGERIQSALLAMTTHNGEWEGLQAGVGLLGLIAAVEGIAALIGLVLLVWSLRRSSLSATQG